MPIQKVDAVRQCQPLKQTFSAVPLRDSVAFKNTSDQFSRENTNNNTANLEAKYDFACRIIALKNQQLTLKNQTINYYKTQYEKLLEQKCCCV